jgi:hypothetical protein
MFLPACCPLQLVGRVLLELRVTPRPSTPAAPGLPLAAQVAAQGAPHAHTPLLSCSRLTASWSVQQGATCLYLQVLTCQTTRVC